MKNRKLSNIINLTFESDTIKGNKRYTRVLEISDLKRIVEIINNIGLTNDFNIKDNYKLLMNFKTKKYYLLQSTDKFLNSVDDDEIRTEFIMELYKNFYTKEELHYDDKMLKKNRKIKQEIAPYKFNVNSSYIEEDRGYCIVNIIENIYEINNIINIIQENDIWLSVDFNKLDQEKILKTITRIEENDFKKVKIDKFIKKHIPEIKEKLRKEDIIQCEFKMLHFNNDINLLNDNNEKLINKFRILGIDMFQVKERINIIRAFNSSIYPYRKMEVTQSLSKENFINLVGGEY